VSAIQFLIDGGMASIGGDLPLSEQNNANFVVKKFAEKLRATARAMVVPAAMLKVQQSNYLLVAKDTASLHFIFADAPGGTALNYRDLSAYNRLELQGLVHQITIDVGNVAWAFSVPLGVPMFSLESEIAALSVQYVASVLETQKSPDKRISEEAISVPEIASGLEKFRADYPLGKRTAFIIMQFAATRPHAAVVKSIRDILARHNIMALRADDKQYMDDLFPNIKTYMHACDFGVAVFDRIAEDDFNPNVSLEVGYMLGMGKNVLLLKDRTLRQLQTDLAGKLYKQFDTNDVDGTLPAQVERWLKDKGLA